MIQIHPSIRPIIDPIVDRMTNIYNRKRMQPECGPHTESDADKFFQRRCVHMIKDDHNEYRIPIIKQGDDYICEACGRRINAKFDEAAVKKIIDAIEVIDGLTVFAPMKGLMGTPLQNLISVKSILPEIAKLDKEFNEFVKRDDSTANANGVIGGDLVRDYNTPARFSSITGMV
jgi:hypothetical protein